jgi:hypothetical protein
LFLCVLKARFSPSIEKANTSSAATDYTITGARFVATLITLQCILVAVIYMFTTMNCVFRKTAQAKQMSVHGVWHRAFHGTKHEHVPSILELGQLVPAGRWHQNI